MAEGNGRAWSSEVKDLGDKIVTLTVNLGQPAEDWDVAVGKARDLGALDAIVVDAREEFAREYVLRAIKANALYGGGYPLFTALGRPLIARLAVEHARRTGCDTVAHGCTGKGNDQVRIEATVATLDPELGVIAPVRDWQMGREEEVAYAREHGIDDLKVTPSHLVALLTAGADVLPDAALVVGGEAFSWDLARQLVSNYG